MLRKLILVLFVSVILISSASATWWNESYEERYFHNDNNSGYTGIGYFRANVSGWYGIINGSSAGQVYTYNNTDNGLAVANDTDELCWFDTANDRSNCPKQTGSASNLVVYWSLDDDTSGLAKDYIGGNDGTLNGGILTDQPGQVNEAYDFDGGDDNVEIPKDSSLDIPSEGALTISAWINIETVQLGNILRADDTGAEGIDGTRSIYMLRLRSDGTLQGAAYEDGMSNSVSVNPPDTPSTGTWHHVVFTMDMTGNAYLYLDGSQIGSADASALSNEIDPATSRYIGAWFDNSNSVLKELFNGKIDDVRVYNTALSSTEVSNLYSSTKDKFPYLGAKETQAPVDTCSCPGAGNDWEIDMSDYCNITEDCDLTTGTLNFTGSGETRINATINTTDLGDPGTNGILKILSDCLIWVI